jgi:hypothetical protein
VTPNRPPCRCSTHRSRGPRLRGGARRSPGLPPGQVSATGASGPAAIRSASVGSVLSSLPGCASVMATSCCLPHLPLPGTGSAEDTVEMARKLMDADANSEAVQKLRARRAAASSHRKAAGSGAGGSGGPGPVAEGTETQPPAASVGQVELATSSEAVAASPRAAPGIPREASGFLGAEGGEFNHMVAPRWWGQVRHAGRAGGGDGVVAHVPYASPVRFGSLYLCLHAFVCMHSFAAPASSRIGYWPTHPHAPCVGLACCSAGSRTRWTLSLLMGAS